MLVLPFALPLGGQHPLVSLPPQQLFLHIQQLGMLCLLA